MSQKQLEQQLEAVNDLSKFLITQDWEKAKPYLSDDLFYKAGSSEPIYGPQAVLDFFKWQLKNIAVVYDHDVREIWRKPNIITIEMDAKFELIGSKKRVTVACCDVYRMRGNQVSEWRVYADVFPLYADKAPWETR